LAKESTLQTKCIQHLKRLRIYHFNVFGAGRCGKGAPDVIACINGRFVAFEFKIGSNDMQPDQEIHKKRIIQNGGLHFVPRTLDEFIQIVEEVRSGELG
jgi:hypothetical protein